MAAFCERRTGPELAAAPASVRAMLGRIDGHAGEYDEEEEGASYLSEDSDHFETVVEAETAALTD